jgi:hypothetical protein
MNSAYLSSRKSPHPLNSSPSSPRGGGPRREAPWWRGETDSDFPLHQASPGPPPRASSGRSFAQGPS